MNYYAEIGDDNICFAVLNLDYESENEKQIAIPEYDSKYLGAVYENESWTFPEVVEEPTEEEEYQAQVLLNQMEILNNQADMDATIAEILLNQI